MNGGRTRMPNVVLVGTLVATSLFGGAACVTDAPSAADASRLPRMPWNDPDLQGIWSVGYLITPLERPAEYADREFLTNEEVLALEKQAAESFGKGGGAASGPRGAGRPPRGTVQDVEGAYNDVFSGRGTNVVRTKRTSFIIEPSDGRIPPRTPDGQRRANAGIRQTSVDDENARAGPADHPEDRRRDRCRGVAIPISFGGAAASGGMIRLVQAPGQISIYYEDGHNGGAYRVVPLDRREPLPTGIRQWLGDARGQWDGDTLVVNTSNFSALTNYHGSSDGLRLIERFTRAADDLLLYQVTIDDPTTFSRPWTIEVPYTKSDEKRNQIFEAACHEGNYALTSILAGARAKEKQRP